MNVFELGISCITLRLYVFPLETAGLYVIHVCCLCVLSIVLSDVSRSVTLCAGRPLLAGQGHHLHAGRGHAAGRIHPGCVGAVAVAATIASGA